MNNPTPNHGLRRCTGGRDDQRGSAILLVLVAMVLMAILAGSLLQLTRFERIPRSESNIEVVIASVVEEIANQLTDDLLDSDGNFLNTQYTATNDGGDEPWDFPYTNTAVAGVRVPIDQDGNPVTGVVGGVMDDAWLADHMPDFRNAGQVPATSIYSGGGNNNTVGVWRKITSLTGLYLRGQNGTSNLSSGSGNLNEDKVDFSTVNNRDMNISTTAGFLVDADGDGIGDSRWEWAPLRQVGATQYVMAVRIVDLSARADVNVALGSTPSPTTGAITLSTEGPRGDGPTELDGAAFMALLANTTGSGVTLANARSDWRKAIEYRFTANAAATGTASVIPYDGNTTTPTLGSRREYWNNGASRVSNTFQPNGEDPSSATYDYTNTFGLVDAFELLQGNGLNSPTTTTLEDLMPNLLWRDNGQEDGYGAGAGTNKRWTDEKDFWELDPRKHLSPFTGSSVAVKPAAVAQPRELKIDVNKAAQSSALSQLQNKITDFLNSANSTTLLALYPHLSTVADFSNQFTACIDDYIDDDNNVTTVSSHTGFEALPYITEVYTQRLYNGTVAASGAAGINNVTWTAAGVQGYALEIGNPFAQYNGTSWVGRPISLDDVYLHFNSGTATELSSITGVPNELKPGEVIYLYQDSDGTTTATSDHDLSTYDQTVTTATNYTNVIRAEGPALPAGATLTEITISLHATEQGGTAPATWSYNACDIEVGGDTLSTETVSDTDFTVGQAYQTFVQTSYQGVGEGLRMMTVVADPSGTNGYNEVKSSLTSPSDNCDSGTGTRGPIRPALGDFSNETKPRAPSGFSSLDNQQIVWPDSERERMLWIGDLLQVPLIGPNRTASGNATNMANTFADAAASPGRLNTDGIDALYLPYQRYSGTTAAPVVNNNTANTAASGSRFGVYNYPHAVLLLEQLTTFSPASDGENGDGSSPAGTESVTSPNDDEVLIPGRLNLNTAPRETLVRLLPFPDLTVREDVADAIIARRENIVQANASASGGYATGANDIPAIAYTAALYEQIENLTTNPSQVAGDTTTLGGVRIDLNDYEDRGALNDYDPSTAGSQYPGLADGVADDREEQIMLAKWLSEVADTRSDVFAAYIVVQGYPVDSFTDGATESARLIVIFSRAGVKGTGDKAVEIGRFRIN